MAGFFPAGFGPSGIVPPLQPSPVLPPLTPRAVFYNPRTKQYELYDANGNAIDVHPVDQIVATRLTSEQGSSASNPTLGQRIRARIAAAAPSKHQQIAQQEINATLADLVIAGDVVVISVHGQRNPSNGALEFAVTYQNMRDPTRNPQRPLPSLLTI